MRKFIFYQSRLFEWIAALAMLSMGLLVGAVPSTVSAGNFYLVQRVGLSHDVIFALMFLFGVARIAALVANGYAARIGPRVRAVGAGVAGLVWSQMFLALGFNALSSGTDLSMGFPIYVSLTIGEVISCYRAASDARNT